MFYVASMKTKKDISPEFTQKKIRKKSKHITLKKTHTREGSRGGSDGQNAIERVKKNSHNASH